MIVDLKSLAENSRLLRASVVASMTLGAEGYEIAARGTNGVATLVPNTFYNPMLTLMVVMMFLFIACGVIVYQVRRGRRREKQILEPRGYLTEYG